MIGKSTARMRLCPKCANSIEEDATNCRYCKAELLSDDAPEWLKREEPLSDSRARLNSKKKFPIPAKFIWPAAMLVVALLAFFAGGYRQRNELLLASQANQKQLQATDQIIRSQETQLAETRKQLDANSNQVTELKSKLEESQKEVSAARQRLAVASREVDRANANRPVAVRRTASRASDTRTPPPTPVSARRTAQSGVYETTQATSVHENPSSTARVVTQINRGTRINVVGSAGEWLEVRSKHGNPPGYVRSDDARLVTRAN
jgi:hypothetical protein